MKRSINVFLVIFFVLLIDQSLKIWVKTHMEYGGEIQLFGLDWALIHFVENNGMAFGITLGGAYGKLVLSLFRILAVGFLFYYLRYLIKSSVSYGLLLSFAFILAGALGNIIDSAFYGLIFSESPYHGGVATLFPSGGGYSSLLHGKVVDMLYFPVLQGYFPEWMPFWAGEPYLFFKPVFNIADLSITIGVMNILIFQRHFFTAPAHQAPAVEAETTTEEEPPAHIAAEGEHRSESASSDGDTQGAAFFMTPPPPAESSEGPEKS